MRVFSLRTSKTLLLRDGSHFSVITSIGPPSLFAIFFVSPARTRHAGELESTCEGKTEPVDSRTPSEVQSKVITIGGIPRSISPTCAHSEP